MNRSSPTRALTDALTVSVLIAACAGSSGADESAVTTMVEELPAPSHAAN
jgi:hypothetical protein